jgi:hypothetical protein
LREIKHGLRDAAQTTLNSVGEKPNASEVQSLLIERLRVAGISVGEPSSDQARGYGHVLNVTLAQPLADRALMALTTTVSIPCGMIILVLFEAGIGLTRV